MSATASQSNRFERGSTILREIGGQEVIARCVEALAGVAPDLGRYVVEFAFGDTYARPGLTAQQRQLITIGALAALGGAETQIAVQVDVGLNVGLAPKEIVDAIIHTVPYIGFPRAVNAVMTAQEVFGKRGLMPLTDVGADVQ
jgi:4-carboxymuconolactone decarboxylase